MNKIFTMIVALIILVLAITYVAYLADNDFSINNIGSDNNQVSLTVSSEGPLRLDRITSDIRTNEYYSGYDMHTLLWMEQLGDKYVFVSDDAFVVMNLADANNIPSQYVTDAYINEHITCNVLENRSLGQNNNLRDVLYVYNVKCTGEEIHYFDV